MIAEKLLGMDKGLAAVAIDEELPLRISLADSREQREVHRRALDVQWLVILDDLHRAQRIERARRNVDDLTEHLEVRAL